MKCVKLSNKETVYFYPKDFVFLYLYIQLFVVLFFKIDEVFVELFFVRIIAFNVSRRTVSFLRIKERKWLKLI